MILYPDRKIQPPVNTLPGIALPVPEVVKLANGISVYLFSTGQQDVLSVELIFGAGSWFQPKPFTAMGTNLMLREGTKTKTARQISETFDFFGAHIECATERDNAYVTLYTLNKHLNQTLPLLLEIITQPEFPEHELEVVGSKQKQLLEVNRQKVSFIARTQFSPLIYGGDHPYGQFLQPDDITCVKQDNLKNFHAKHYNASNCTVIAAGKITPDIRQTLFAVLNEIPIGEKVKQEIRVENPISNRNHFIEKPQAVQSAIRMGRVMFGRAHSDFAGIKVLNAVLGGYFGSRLMTNLREDKGYTYGIGSALVPLRRGGYFVLSTEVGAGVTDKAVSEINSELLRLCNDLVPESELSLVRNYLLGELLRSVDGPFEQAGLYRELIEDQLDASYFSTLIETIKHISASEIRDLATKYLSPDHFHTLVVGP
jgi:predicted Zn-dependent peptidase